MVISELWKLSQVHFLLDELQNAALEESSLHYSMAVTEVYFYLTSQTLLVLTTDRLKTGAKEQVHLTHSIHVLIFIAAGETVICSLALFFSFHCS